ncbi:hypothetical protein Dimus_022705 [Dionaea muscipula]
MGKPFQEKRVGSCRCCKEILCKNDCDPFEEEGCCEIQRCVEESKYTKPLEITRRFANDENIMAKKEGQVREPKPAQRFVHFFVMKNVVAVFGKSGHLKLLDLTYMDHLMSRRKLTRKNGIWWIGSRENRRRDDDVDAPEEEAEEEDKGIKDDFNWEAVIDEATVEGESCSRERFYDAEDKDQGSPEVQEEIPAAALRSRARKKERLLHESTLVSHRVIPEAKLLKFQAEFERKRANRFHDDLEKAKAENVRLIALLHQAQSKPHL